MGHHLERGKNLEKKADNKLHGWSFLGKRHQDAAQFYELAADSYKLAKSWDEAGPAYLKLANCFLKLGCKHEAAHAYAEAGHAYQKTSHKQAALPCLEESVNCFLKIGRLDKAALYSYELAVIYETEEQDLVRAYAWFEKAAKLLQKEDASSSVNGNTGKEFLSKFAKQWEKLRS